ncbi:cell surface receptor IPT TIG domain-containing protein [Fusarium circinatum]|uniref:Cell surface receptor IPT TIG domain-containing protein n=1 Tax=Fusarium circinatum TaxID=48490 RepID=A0A8H6CTU9_FUSCI|nr:cell surface receptor IPT TIG domain-containing protein [Fusarium circinatum]
MAPSPDGSAAGRPPDATLLIPMKIDLLGLGNQEAYSAQCPDVTLLPTNLFDYSKLRLRKQTVQADLQDHADFDSARVTTVNPRLYDLTTSQPRPHVSGISISWTLPQLYRWESKSDKQDEFSTAATPPNRWMVARVTRNAATNAGWVIESDVCRHIDDMEPSVDLMTDVSQYIRAPEKLTDERIIDLQGEYFLGEQRNLEGWAERSDSSTVIRVKPLKANSAGNILFADYQPHNPNVFSFHDPLGGIPAGTEIGYSVIGWHADTSEDPWMSKAPNITNGQLLAQLNMVLDKTKMDQADVTKWTTSQSPARHICHGSTYTLLKWDPDAKSIDVSNPSLSAEAQAVIMKADGSLAVGTDPFDAFGALMQAGNAAQSHQDLQKLQNIAVSGNHHADLDKQTAADEFMRIFREFKLVEGGSQWKVAPSGDKGDGNANQTDPGSSSTPQLTDDDKTALQEINSVQWACDHILFNIDYRRWKLFCEWWRCVTNDALSGTDQVSSNHSALVTEIKSLDDTLTDARNHLETLISNFSLDKKTKVPNFELTKVPFDSFVQRKDPTVALLGCKSPWPDGFSDCQPVRLLSQCIKAFTAKNFGDTAYQAAMDMTDYITSIPNAAALVHGEHVGYMCASVGDSLLELKANEVIPPYCNAVFNTEAVLDSPLVPLYVEWEAEYFHIPYGLWEPQHARRTAAQVYPELTQSLAPKRDVSSNEFKFPRRAMGGRALLHPSPGGSVANVLRNSVGRLPESMLEGVLAVDKRDQLYANMEAIPSLACRLDGFHDQLVTLISGTAHVRPTLPDGTAMPEAVTAGKAAGFTADTLGLVRNHCDPLPYGDGIDPEAVFIPVTHGQVKFSKFNVIDKFGRGVEIVDRDGLMPSISSVYQPSSHVVDDKETPNVVHTTGGDCEYFQIPPSINQPARLFSTYLKPGGTGESTWRPCGEWEDPVCGYIMYNSVDLSLLVFSSAGDLRAEILTSEGDAAARVAQLNEPPMSDGLFEPPLTDTADQWKAKILDGFIKNLKTEHYALRMIEILGDASSCMAPPAESYSSVMNAAFGRPFALAIAGWSIELNHEELQPQTSLRNLAGKSYSKLSDYDLPLHLGLKEYSDDGLAAYMPLQSDAPTQPDFSNIFTFWPGGVAKTDLNEGFACNLIHPSTLPTLKAHHVDLFKDGRLLEVDDMIKSRQDQISPFCLLVDVFHPVKAQTGVLPPSSLALPDWAVQQALRKIRLCYRAGPFLFREDPLKSLKAKGAEETPAPSAAGDGVHVPVVPYGKWSWLQPYIVDGDMKYYKQDVGKAEAKGDVLEVRKYPFTMADGIMMSTEPLLHQA